MNSLEALIDVAECYNGVVPAAFLRPVSVAIGAQFLFPAIRSAPLPERKTNW
jgi:hypothetical protein